MTDVFLDTVGLIAVWGSSDHVPYRRQTGPAPVLRDVRTSRNGTSIAAESSAAMLVVESGSGQSKPIGLRPWPGPCRRPSRLRASGRAGSSRRALVAGLPAHDVDGLGPLLAHLLPLLGPGGVGLGDLAGLLVEEEGLALAVGLDAHVDRGDRGVAEVGRAEGLLVARADAADEVVPQGAGVVARRVGGECSPPSALFDARRGGPALDLLRDDVEAVALRT